MPAGQIQTIRKGTKSCTECRRRKIRCIQSFENAQTCRRCEERGSKCTAQTHTSGSTGTHGLSSKDRIARLESRVLSLTETVDQMQQKLNCEAKQNEELNVDPNFGGDSSDSDTCVSEQSIAEQPFHLRLLFQNDWLSAEKSSESQAIQGHQTTHSAYLLYLAKRSLQKLIPSKDKISDHADSASVWLTMLHSFFPLPFSANCGNQVIACYEEMHSPSVDTLRLASWLLTVALIAEQLPPKHGSMEARVNERERQLLSKAISETVETKILAHDRLAGSVQGLSLSMQCIRLQLGRGKFHIAWVKLRHTIAIAELMGFHNMVQADQLETATGAVDEWHISKAWLWNLICAADRLLGMILNLPPITSRHQQAISHSISIDGIVQNQVYLCRLTNIATKIQDLDQFSMSNGSKMEAYTFALQLSRELKELASQTPEAWWSGGVHGVDNVHPDHIVQFLHFYVAMRVHLPLTLRQGTDGENFFNCLACVDACESMVQRYEFLSCRLPPGLFLSETLDLQAFSAAVTLLLISYMLSIRSLDTVVDKIKINSEVGQVIKLLHEKSDGPHGSETAYTGFTTLCSLNDLLHGTKNGVDVRKIALRAPLLGKVQVKRNEHPSQADSYWPSQVLSAFGLCYRTENTANLNLDVNLSMGPSFDAENLQWDTIANTTEGILRELL